MFGRRNRGKDRAGKESDALRGTPVDPHQGDRSELARPQGPWDVDDIDLDSGDSIGDSTGNDSGGRVDLGGLIVTAGPGLEVRLQVDPNTQNVIAVLLVGPEGAVEARAFAAPRNETIWDDVRREIGAEATRRGGTATEQGGEFGPEVKLVVPMQTPDGKPGTQTSRVVGVSAPRWLLRGTFLGKPAVEPDPDGVVEAAFRRVIVRRGDSPMPPRASIPLTMPATGPGAADAEQDGRTDEQSGAPSGDQ
ncbi:MAG: DUF3710 domain-containing protein [Propionibacteriales bacterium]|nr:DUF3710 domain-containing protein [Propionibacteriales bacterium]